MLTPDSASRLVALYEVMADAARDNDWGRLAELERDATAIRKTAKGNDSDPTALRPGELVEIAVSIQRVLELDREIRTHAEPARESIRKLLSTTVRDRTVRNAYSGFGG